MTKITMIIAGPESSQTSELINRMILEAVIKRNVILKRFDMDELPSESGQEENGMDGTAPVYRQRKNDMEIKIPEFLLQMSRRPEK